MEFGERPGQAREEESATEQKARQSKRKLAERGIRGTWLGLYPWTGEHIIATRSEEAIRIHTVKRIRDGSLRMFKINHSKS